MFAVEFNVTVAKPSEMTRKLAATMESVLLCCTTTPPPTALSVTLPSVVTVLAPPATTPKVIPLPFRLRSKMSPIMVGLPMTPPSSMFTPTPAAVAPPVPVIRMLPVPVAFTLPPLTTYTPELLLVPAAPAVPVMVVSPLTALTAAPLPIRTPIWSIWAAVPPVPVMLKMLALAVLTLVFAPSKNTPIFEAPVPAPAVPVILTAPVPLEVTFAPL